MPASIVNEAWGHWFAGFFAGEGCFQIRRQKRANNVGYACTAGIELRRDDLSALQDVQLALGIGHVLITEPRGTNAAAKPQVRWQVSSKGDCQTLTEVFNVYPLRARKGHEFWIWSRAVQLWSEMPRRGGRSETKTFDWSAMERLYAELKIAREYREPLAA